MLCQLKNGQQKMRRNHKIVLVCIESMIILSRLNNPEAVGSLHYSYVKNKIDMKWNRLEFFTILLTA